MADEKTVMVPRLTRRQRLGLAALVVTALLMVGGSIFVWSGYYNVSASRDHWGVTTWLLTQVRDQSIRLRAGGKPVPDLGNPDLIALGAEHYRGGCATCHGEAGEEQNPIYARMLPSPPNLIFAADHYEPGALHWIVNSGLKFTGMPAWPASGRADEVWAVVAFLEALHARGPEIQQPLTLDEAAAKQAVGAGIIPLENCIRCHGDAATPPVSSLVPSLNGQSSEYLMRSLVEYRLGKRQSGIMAPIAHEMTPEEVTELTTYYAALSPVAVAGKLNPDTVKRGAEIALAGVPAMDVPACFGCHAGANPQFPRLAGQSNEYLVGQLKLWQNGLRDQSGYGAIMSVIARRLSLDQIEDVSAYFASLGPAPRNAEPRTQGASQ